jgi:dihydroneopterin aldolase
MGRIFLEQMEFFSHHGCFTEEQIIGNKFTVDIIMEAETAIAEASDNLSDTVNYQEVYNIVKTQMHQNSKLLEHVAARIANEIKNTFPEIISLSVKVSKLNPPLGGKLEKVSVEVTR